MLTDKDPESRRLQESRTSSIPDAYFSEMVAYADLVLPDTTYLERLGLHLAARPADLRGRYGRPIRSASRWSPPDRDVRALPGRCCSTWARASACRASIKEDGTAQLSRRLRRLHRQPRAPARRRPAWPVGAAQAGDKAGRGEPNPAISSNAMSKTDASGTASWRSRSRRFYFKHANKSLPGLRRRDGLHRPGGSDR